MAATYTPSDRWQTCLGRSRPWTLCPPPLPFPAEPGPRPRRWHARSGGDGETLRGPPDGWGHPAKPSPVFGTFFPRHGSGTDLGSTANLSRTHQPDAQTLENSGDAGVGTKSLTPACGLSGRPRLERMASGRWRTVRPGPGPWVSPVGPSPGALGSSAVALSGTGRDEPRCGLPGISGPVYIQTWDGRPPGGCLMPLTRYTLCELI